MNFSYDKAIEINQKDGNYWNNKGDAFYYLNKYEQALEWLTFSLVNKIFYSNFSYDKAIEINPKDGEYWHNKGISFYDLKKYEQALEWYYKYFFK